TVMTGTREECHWPKRWIGSSNWQRSRNERRAQGRPGRDPHRSRAGREARHRGGARRQRRRALPVPPAGETPRFGGGDGGLRRALGADAAPWLAGRDRVRPARRVAVRVVVATRR